MSFIKTKQNIPPGWQEKKLGEICDIVNGSTPKRSISEYWDGGTIPWFTVDDIRSNGRIINSTNQNITNKALKETSVKLLPEDSVLLCCTASLGEVAIAKIPLTTNQQFNGLISKDKKNLFPNYFFYSAQKLGENLKSKSGKTTINFLSVGTLSKEKVLLPPVNEQQKIAEILGAVDEDIAKTQEVIDATEKLKRGLMQQLFTRGIDDGVNELELKKISKVTSSKRIMRSEYVERGIPFYRSKEIIEKSKGIKHDSIFYISRERFSEIEEKFDVPHIGDILITAVGTIGVVYLVDEERFYFKDGNLLWIKDIDESLDKSYLKYYMNSEIFQKRVLGTAIGSSQKALTIEKVEKVIVPIPKLSEQKKIAEILSVVDEKISVNKKLKEKLTLLKKGLMQDLLSGKVRTN